MAKIPFDIKYRPQIESGEYKVVIEYDNRTFYARIVCWDFNSTELLACVNYGDREDVLEYDSSGKHIGKSVGRPDLIIITPEPELSEFESKVKYIVDNLTNNITYRNVMKERFNRGDEDEQIKEYASELLTLARKELEPEVLERLEAAYKNQDEVVYENGKRDGKAEAFKNLPRWKKAAASFGNYSVAPTETGQLCLLIDGYYIMLSDLKKLTGFNE